MLVRFVKFWRRGSVALGLRQAWLERTGCSISKLDSASVELVPAGDRVFMMRDCGGKRQLAPLFLEKSLSELRFISNSPSLNPQAPF